MERTTLRRFVPIVCALLASACAQQQPSGNSQTPAPPAAAAPVSPDASNVQQPASNATAANTTGDRLDAHSSTKRACYLKVDGVIQVDGPCLVYPMGDNDYTLNTWTEGKPAHSHFAVVMTNADGTATATWNADPDDDRALDPLGTVRKHGDCWVNDRARICVKEAAAAPDQ